MECTHVFECGLSGADDLEIWTFATLDDRIVISKDEDFVFLANRSGDTGRLVWVRLGNCRNTALLTAFDGAKEALLQAFESGQRIVELR